MIKQIKAWWRRIRSKMQHEENPLREFMYLDEVSVTSLLSSRTGAIPSEITETMSSSTRSEVTRGIEADIKILKPSIGSVLENTRTQDRQVLRKATIQATFRDLYRHERGTLAIRPIPESAVLPTQSQMRTMLHSPDRSVDSPWLISSERLVRGNLIEVDVELQADPIFRVSSFFSNFLDMITESEELAGQVDQGQAAKVREFNGILERLRVGLIPIRCRLVDYQSFTTTTGDYLIHRRILEAWPEQRPNTTSAYLVGVTEHDLYWKDTRRILFSDARVSILCRLNKFGIQSSWNAVKLADMVGTLLPEFTEMMNRFGSDALHAMMTDSNSPSTSDSNVETLIAFSCLVAAEGGISLSDQDNAGIQRLAEQNAHLLEGGLLEMREAMASISDFIQAQHGVVLDPEKLSSLRTRARSQAGLRQGLTLQGANTAPSPPPPSEESKFLDSEVIAIYW
ncbi:hypothetical protein [Streptomyces sp. NPDC058155]|uniref:DUF6414 family protein n=1 Tax=Streptomyces sp. NPDC058155 TaxID=3346359 RepID=UPI0036F074EB